MKKLKVYVGCALTDASEEYKAAIGVFKNTLRETGFIEILDFVDFSADNEPPEAIPGIIYYHDIRVCVRKADVVLGEVSISSSGLGYELATTIEKYQRPVYIFAKKSPDVRVSKLILGIPTHNPKVQLHWYRDSFDEVVFTIIKELQEIHRRKNQWIPVRILYWLHKKINHSN